MNTKIKITVLSLVAVLLIDLALVAAAVLLAIHKYPWLSVLCFLTLMTVKVKIDDDEKGETQ